MKNSLLFNNVIRIITAFNVYFIVFWGTTLFYIFLWFVNPGNKFIAASFIPLCALFYLRIKNFRISLLLTYLVSMIIFTGKTYVIQLIPAGVFPKEVFPDGYIIFFILSIRHLIAVFMLIVLGRDIIITKVKRFRLIKKDLLLILFFLWVVISDIFSSRPEISLLFSLTSLEALILYFYLRVYVENNQKVLLYILWIFIAIILFQSSISLMQIFYNSPVFKNIEHQVHIVYFGWAADELQFRFRPLGTFPHANILGAWLAFLLSWVFSSLFKRSSSFILFTLIAGSVTLIMTLSRSSWLGYLVSIMTILFISEKVNNTPLPKIVVRQLVSLLILAVLLLIFFILPRFEKTLYSFVENQGGGSLRVAQIEEAIELVLQHPFLGVGSNMSVQEGLKLNPAGIFSKSPITVHNWYILLASEHGLPAVLLFFSFMLLSIKQLWQNILKKKGNLSCSLMIGSLSGVLAILISVLFQNFMVLNLILLPLAIFTHKEKIRTS